MHYLLFIGAVVFFAFIAPLKLAVTVCALVLVVTVAVKVSAQVVAGASPTLGEAFRPVFYASLLVALVLLAFMSFSSGTGVHHIDGWPAVAVLSGLFVAYTLGFQIGIGTSFGASAVVALISTLLSGAILWSVKNLASF
ncbi:MAG TPA: hypothetical protein VF555_18720 [Variovorax sp.]